MPSIKKPPELAKASRAHPPGCLTPGPLPLPQPKPWTCPPRCVNKTTLLIIRAINGGKVSRCRDKHGPWRIAPAESHRVYPSTSWRSAPDAPQRDTMATLEAQIAGLREVADLLRAQLDETRRDRDKWADATTAALRALPPPAESLPTKSGKLSCSKFIRSRNPLSRENREPRS